VDWVCGIGVLFSYSDGVSYLKGTHCFVLSVSVCLFLVVFFLVLRVVGAFGSVNNDMLPVLCSVVWLE
jgi:hypothetical protein